jgi:hypothetical protein
VCVLNAEHYVYAVAPHMHYIGKRMAAWVDRPEEGTPMCPAAEGQPFSSCMLKNCLSSDDSVEVCIEKNCADEVGALSGLCEVSLRKRP